MKNNKKTILITSIILGVLILTISLTYAVFSMSKTGQNSSLVVGDVYMHYANGNKSINLANVMPSETYDATSFFEFTIDGKNTTTNKDIWYEIILKHGDVVSGKTRIKDNLLKFTLTETKNGTTTTVFDGRSYNDLTNKRIWVNTINKNTTSEVSITYRLYMWISNATNIGNTEDVDYTIEEWKNVFASIKVDVAGDFNEKSIATNESCFTVGTINNGNEVAILDYDRACGTDVIIPNTIKGYPVTVIGNSETSVIEQLSNKNNDYKLNDLNNYQQNVNIKPTTTRTFGSFQGKNLTSVVIPNSVTIIDEFAFKGNQLTSVIIPDSVTTISREAFSDNQLTSVTIGNGIQYIGIIAFEKYIDDNYNPNLSKITINKSCTDIKNIQGSSTITTKYYPWLSYNSPYTASGVTIYGSNNEVCDSF